MAAPPIKDLIMRSPAGSSEVITFTWPLQIGTGQDKHDNGIDIIDTIKFVCDEMPSISSAFEEINLHKIDTACFKTMTNLVDRFNKAVDSIVALEKGTSLPAERLNKFAHPSLLRHILQLVYNAAVLDPDKLNNYEPFSPEVYGETSYELVEQMIKHVNVSNEDTFIDLGSGVGQVVLQMAGSFPLKTCIGIEKADTPALYAERMHSYFRQFMAWFGKRYCEYKLIKGDFLMDEHREKITSSSLVFVNNFAFGPNVDHQLKERFADLRDGARVVSSKSFCPLNFRITDRNLSDIGTIMNVSEIPPLKGSVSWTCKPVSYYLHVIDRTILERYFQEKTRKADNEHNGSTRTTRDRAKREASNNSNSNSLTARTNSPATNANNSNSTTPPTSKTARTQRQQNIHDMDSSSESEGDRAANGPTTRKVWSDWGKSSQSEDEELNNNHNTAKGRTRINQNAQKKRKKLTRKAAIASKSAAAAARQREAAVAAKEAIVQREDGNSSNATATNKENGSNAAVNKGRKGRIRKGAKGRKCLKIVGLDILHDQTLLSTSDEKMCKKQPAAPGCVDQQLTSLLTRNMSHTELDIPEAPKDTPYALQILLDVFRSQLLAMVDYMKSKDYVPHIRRQIQLEQERKQRIKNRASQLDKQIKTLIDDSVALLKVRMNELGINVSSPNDLIAKAKEIVGRHKELQCAAKRIQSQVNSAEVEHKHLIRKHVQYLPEYQKLSVNNKNGRLENAPSNNDLSEAAVNELVLKEIANTLVQRKKLHAQVSNIENEIINLDKVVEERRTAAALLAQGTNMIIANAATAPTSTSAASATSLQPLQLTTTTSKNHLNNITCTPASTVSSTYANNTVPNSQIVVLNTCSSKTSNPSGPAVTNVCGKGSRRNNRENRSRSQEWPDVPDVGKIEESNPEVLAQKILETGRKIEAGKFSSGGTTSSSNVVNYSNSSSNGPISVPAITVSNIKPAEEKQRHNYGGNTKHVRNSSGERANLPTATVAPITAYHHHAQSTSAHGHQDSTLMPAPAPAKVSHLPGGPNQSQMPIHAQTPNNIVRSGSILPKCELPGRKSYSHNQHQVGSSNPQESPKVANFEDRLKSIITSALNEDQEARKASQQKHHLTPSDINLRVQQELSVFQQQTAAQHLQQQQPSTAPPPSKRGRHAASSMPGTQHNHQQQLTITPNHQVNNASGLTTSPAHQQFGVAAIQKPSTQLSGSSSTSPATSLQIPHNLNNIITVATQGLTHLNANTTISPVTPPLPPPTGVPNNNAANSAPYVANIPPHISATPIAAHAMTTQSYTPSKYKANASAAQQQYSSSAKYPASPSMKAGKVSMTELAKYQPSSIYGANTGSNSAASDFSALHNHRRRNSVSAVNFEQYNAQQQQALLLAATTAAQHQQQQQHISASRASPIPAHSSLHSNISITASNHGLHGQHSSIHGGHHLPMHHGALEFKAPPMSNDHHSPIALQAQPQQLVHQPQHQQLHQRSSSREQMLLVDTSSDHMTRSGSANSLDSLPSSALSSSSAYYGRERDRDRLSTQERSNSCESAAALSQHDSLSRPGSNNSQPDYTQVSPAKMALRRHLSQEKLNQIPSAPNTPISSTTCSKTIGDLVNGEIERTLEISHQSIINAAVLSTVGGSGMLDRERYILERCRERERELERSHIEQQQQRLLINTNVQRPERVHVRVPDEGQKHAASIAVNMHHHHPGSGSNVYSTDMNRSKSPTIVAHNLATLAQVATYNQKSTTRGEPISIANNSVSMAEINIKSPSSSSSSSNRHYTNSRDVSYHTTNREIPPYRGSGSGPSSINASPNSSRSNSVSGRNIDYQPVTLPRAEMKGCIEAYFNEENHQQQLNSHQHHQIQQHQPHLVRQKERSRNGGRINGSNPPLEGLAASLQDHVLASRKYKEETERRAAAAANMETHNQQHHQAHYGNSSSHNMGNYQGHNSSNANSSMKVEVGMKRTSPMSANQPRPSKIAHFAQESSQRGQHHLHQQHHQQINTTLHNPYANTNGGSIYVNPNAISPISPTPLTSSSPTTAAVAGSGRVDSRNRTKIPMDLMSPEIHSIMSGAAAADDERPLQLSSRQHQVAAHQQQQHSRTTTPLSTGGRTSGTTATGGDDDDVIADDETHWQHRVSSGFDRLVAFASTELDKTRRSIDADIVPSSISCNTSPDSGITHSSSSSSNSDAARTFLSTSSTSSQLDMPIGSSGSSSSSSIGSAASTGSASCLSSQQHHHQQQQQQQQQQREHLIVSSSHIRATHHLGKHGDSSAYALSIKRTTALASPSLDPGALESPPLSDVGVPRTPSPSTVHTPPLATSAALSIQRATPPTSLSDIMLSNSVSAGAPNNSLRIPLKYQRKSKTASEKHYKKKFCERNYYDDFDDLVDYGSSCGGGGGGTGDTDSITDASVGSAIDEVDGRHSANIESKPSKSTPRDSGSNAPAVPNKSPKTNERHFRESSATANDTSGSGHDSNRAVKSPVETATTTPTVTSPQRRQDQQQHQHHHKSSKFRPKGKDWDWSLDTSSNGNGNNSSHSSKQQTAANVSRSNDDNANNNSNKEEDGGKKSSNSSSSSPTTKPSTASASIKNASEVLAEKSQSTTTQPDTNASSAMSTKAVTTADSTK